MVCEMLRVRICSPSDQQCLQGCDDEGQAAEDRENRVQSQTVHDSLKQVVEVIEQSGRQRRFAERNTAHRQEHD